MQFCYYFLSGLMYKHSKGNLKKDPVNGNGRKLHPVDCEFQPGNRQKVQHLPDFRNRISFFGFDTVGTGP